MQSRQSRKQTKSSAPDYYKDGGIECNDPDTGGGKIIETKEKRSASEVPVGYCRSYFIFDESRTAVSIVAPGEYITDFYNTLGALDNCSTFIVNYNEMQGRELFTQKFLTEGDGDFYKHRKSDISHSDLTCVTDAAERASRQWKAQEKLEGEINAIVYCSIFGLAILAGVICFIAHQMRNRRRTNDAAVGEKTTLLQGDTQSNVSRLSAVSSLFASCLGAKDKKANTASINTPSA